MRIILFLMLVFPGSQSFSRQCIDDSSLIKKIEEASEFNIVCAVFEYSSSNCKDIYGDKFEDTLSQCRIKDYFCYGDNGAGNIVAKIKYTQKQNKQWCWVKGEFPFF